MSRPLRDAAQSVGLHALRHHVARGTFFFPLFRGVLCRAFVAVLSLSCGLRRMSHIKHTGTLSPVFVIQAILSRSPLPSPLARAAAVETLCWHRELHTYLTYTRGVLTWDALPLGYVIRDRVSRFVG